MRIDALGRKHAIVCVRESGWLASCALNKCSTTGLQLQLGNSHLFDLSARLGNHPHHTVMLEGQGGARVADLKGRPGTPSDSCLI